MALNATLIYRLPIISISVQNRIRTFMTTVNLPVKVTESQPKEVPLVNSQVLKKINLVLDLLKQKMGILFFINLNKSQFLT